MSTFDLLPESSARIRRYKDAMVRAYDEAGSDAAEVARRFLTGTLTSFDDAAATPHRRRRTAAHAGALRASAADAVDTLMWADGVYRTALDAAQRRIAAGEDADAVRRSLMGDALVDAMAGRTAGERAKILDALRALQRDAATEVAVAAGVQKRPSANAQVGGVDSPADTQAFGTGSFAGVTAPAAAAHSQDDLDRLLTDALNDTAIEQLVTLEEAQLLAAVARAGVERADFDHLRAAVRDGAERLFWSAAFFAELTIEGEGGYAVDPGLTAVAVNRLIDEGALAAELNEAQKDREVFAVTAEREGYRDEQATYESLQMIAAAVGTAVAAVLGVAVVAAEIALPILMLISVGGWEAIPVAVGAIWGIGLAGVTSEYTIDLVSEVREDVGYAVAGAAETVLNLLGRVRALAASDDDAQCTATCEGIAPRVTVRA